MWTLFISILLYVTLRAFKNFIWFVKFHLIIEVVGVFHQIWYKYTDSKYIAIYENFNVFSMCSNTRL